MDPRVLDGMGKHPMMFPLRSSLTTRTYALTATILAHLLLSAGMVAQDSLHPTQGEAFDPNQGLDDDGRITRPQIPEEIVYPHRWRYVPEGRIAPGDIFDRFLSTTFISPVIFSEADVGFGGGINLTDMDFRNQRRQEMADISLSYTTEGQQSYHISWVRWTDHRNLEKGGILQNERSYWAATLGYQRTLTTRFFGLGPDTKASDQTSYTDQVAVAGLTRQFAFPEAAGNWIANMGVFFETHQLSSGAVTGIPSTEQVYPDLMTAGDGRSLLWLRGGIALNTRDSMGNPYRGASLGLSVDAAPLQSDGETGAVFGLAGSKVFAIPSLLHDGGDRHEENPPTDSLAFGAFVTATTGNLPFYSLPTLGGSNTLRGYIRNRWTDKAAWHVSGEYRFWFVPRGFKVTDRIRVERIGGAVFYDMGSVANRPGTFGSAGILDSYGFGLRIGFERTAILRLDFGISDDGYNTSLTFGLPF